MFQENDQERDLYERAHQAAKEAEREGDAQLQAAVSPVAVYYPVATPVRFSPWSLRFQDKRLEAVYWRVWSTGWECNRRNSDVWFVTLELACCFLRLCLMPTPQEPQPLLLQLVHVCVGTWFLALIVVQVLFANWYITHRGLLLSYFIILLSCWEGLELFLTANTMFSVLQSVLLSFVHRAPFRSHMTFRAFGICCQFVATFFSCDTTSLARIIPEILLGHFLGTVLAYILDRRARSSFVEALPNWLLVDHRGKPTQPSPSTWNASFYPELLEKPEEALREHVERALVHRALGGFAGGFGGVSGLKCANLSPTHPPVPVTASSSSSPVGQHDLRVAEVTSDSSPTGSTRTEQELLQDSASSASSQVRPSLRRRI